MNEQVLLLSSKLFLLFWIGYYATLTVVQWVQARRYDDEVIEAIQLPLTSLIFLVCLYFFCFYFVAELPQINSQHWIFSSSISLLSTYSNWLVFVGSIALVSGGFLIKIKSCVAQLSGVLLFLLGSGFMLLFTVSVLPFIVREWQTTSSNPSVIFAVILQCLLGISAIAITLAIHNNHRNH